MPLKLQPKISGIVFKMNNWKDSVRKEDKLAVTRLNSGVAYYNTIIVNLINKIHRSGMGNRMEKEILAELEAISEEMSKELYS